MNNRESYTFSRGQFVSLGAVVLSLLIITGVSVAYIGVSGQEERDNAITPTQDMEQSTLSISRSASDVFATTNQDPTMNPDTYSDRQDKVNESIRQYIGSFDEPNSGVYGIVDYNIRKAYSGTMVSQTDPSAKLTGKSGNDTWDVFRNARDARQVVMILNLSSMSNKTQPAVEINSKRFDVKYEKNFVNNTDTVTLIGDSGGSCTVLLSDDADRVKVDFLRGEINSRTCGEIRVDSTVENLMVFSGNTTSANQTPKGTFSTIYQDGDIETTHVNTSSTEKLPGYSEADNPKQTEVVYAVVMDVRVVEMGSSITRPVIISPGKHQNSLE